MEIISTNLSGVKVIQPRHLGDARGYFAETFRADIFAEHFADVAFVQDNESLSVQAGTVRGLHFQTAPYEQGKLVRCTAGAIFDVAVDIRKGSPTYGQWVGEVLTPENGKQLWIPAGFAHGFCSMKENSVVCYKVTNYYNAECDKGVAWDDADIGIAWPEIANADTLSNKDRAQLSLAALPDYFEWSE